MSCRKREHVALRNQQKLHHIGILYQDSITGFDEWKKQGFWIEKESVYEPEFQTTNSLMNSSGGLRVEIVVPDSGSKMEQFMHRRQGVHHLCFIEDLNMPDFYKSLDVKLLVSPTNSRLHGCPVSFYYSKTLGLIEIIHPNKSRTKASK